MEQAHQFLTALSYGDAIGDYTLEIQRILRKQGYESEIFSEVVHPGMTRLVHPLHEYAENESDETLMIVHFSVGSGLGNLVPHLRGKKLLLYHNITPHEWFRGINNHLAYQCLVGRKQLQILRTFCPIALADSEYNRQELESLGYRKTGVMPIQLGFSKFDGPSDPLVRGMYDDHRANIIVVGRVIPNKRLEDCLKAFAYYQKYVNPRSRFIFVGLWTGFEPYYYALREMVTRTQLNEVVFTGHIMFEELLAFYRIADALVTMSEHEGFCVPILEAFYMKVPVLAWNAGAVPFTAGEGAILVSGEKDFAEVGELLHRICSNREIRQPVIEAQCRQLKRLQEYPCETILLNALQDLKQTAPIRTDAIVDRGAFSSS